MSTQLKPCPIELTHAFFSFCWYLAEQAYPAKRKAFKHLALTADQFAFNDGLQDFVITLKDGVLYVACAGSNSLGDWFKNIWFFWRRWLGCKVHRAYSHEVDNAWPVLLERVNSVSTPFDRVVFVCHSRGILGQLYAMRWFDCFGDKPFVVAFGTPKIVRDLSLRFEWLHQHSHLILNPCDRVTKQPRFSKGKHVGIEHVFAYEGDGFEDHLNYQAVINGAFPKELR